jgi:hypothetical protein
LFSTITPMSDALNTSRRIRTAVKFVAATPSCRRCSTFMTPTENGPARPVSRKPARIGNASPAAERPI